MRIKAAKVVIWVLCLSPLAWLVWRGMHEDLGGNPIEEITHQTGLWALRILLLSLAITPARRLLRMAYLIRFRRLLGLFAFFYACLHVLIWLWLDKQFDPSELLADVRKRPFITAGSVGFLMMAPLAFTSTAGSIRRLGGKTWQRLHRLVYIAGAAVVVHYYWLVKSDIRRPLLYMSILAVLLLLRLVLRRRPA